MWIFAGIVGPIIAALLRSAVRDARRNAKLARDGYVQSIHVDLDPAERVWNTRDDELLAEYRDRHRHEFYGRGADQCHRCDRGTDACRCW
jgi:hypothetical protein